MEPTSEQELKQLLDESRITEDEYQDLKQAMAEKDKSQPIEQKQSESKADSTYKLGKIALILALGGVMLCAFAFWSSYTYSHPTDPNIRRGVNGGQVILSLAMELAGFVMGIISWKSNFGKAAAITAGILLLLSVLFIA